MQSNEAKIGDPDELSMEDDRDIMMDEFDCVREDIKRKKAAAARRPKSDSSSRLYYDAEDVDTNNLGSGMPVYIPIEEKTALAIGISTAVNIPGAYDCTVPTMSAREKPTQGQQLEQVRMRAAQKRRYSTENPDRALLERPTDTTDTMTDFQMRMTSLNDDFAIEVAEEDAQLREQKSHQQKKLGLLIAGAILLVAVVVGSVIAFIGGMSGRDSTSTNDGSTIEDDPAVVTPSELFYPFSNPCVRANCNTTVIEMSERYTQLRTTIIDTFFPDMTTAIDTTQGIERAALCWLADYDSFQISTLMEEENEHLIQRFKLALIYFGFLMIEPPRVECSELIFSNTESQEIFASKGWLTNVHECYWDELGCDDDSNTVVEHLGLDGMSLKGSIPTEVALLSSLMVVDLSGNALSGKIPSELWSMTRLKHLWLEGNRLSGTISQDVNNLKELEQLKLSRNTLSGTIPDWWNLKQLRHLDAEGMEGSFPDLSASTSLEILKLGESELIGTLPEFLWSLTNLTTLILGGSSMSGTIATEIELLENLVSLDLTENEFVGTIPSELGRLPSIAIMKFGGNKLTGTVPLELCNVDPTPTLVVPCHILESCICCGINEGRTAC